MLHKTFAHTLAVQPDRGRAIAIPGEEILKHCPAYLIDAPTCFIGV
jgi:hypothetical protein